MESTLKTIAILLISLLFIGNSLADEEKEQQQDQEPEHITYVDMQPSFVSNLRGGPKYIRCDIQLMTKYASNVPEIEVHMPALRHAILMLLAGADGKKLLMPSGKEALRGKALDAVNKMLEELSGKARVQELYFTAYYVK
jgi:flagellar FliL protein